MTKKFYQVSLRGDGSWEVKGATARRASSVH